MSDVAFEAIMDQIDDFSLFQKMTLIRALKKSVPSSLFHKKTASRKDQQLVESLVGVAGNEDLSIFQIKEERLSSQI